MCFSCLVSLPQAFYVFDLVTNTGGNMWVHADYSQVVGEVKERNRYFRALNEIKQIAMLGCNREIPLEMVKQFEMKVKKCDDALKPIRSD